MSGEAHNIRTGAWFAVVLAVLTLAVFWQTVSFDFVKLDDDYYITNNPAVLDGLTADGIRWALTTNYQCMWQPLTWVSFMFDAQVNKWLADVEAEVFPGEAGIFHLTNLLLHTAAVVVLFRVLCLMAGSPWRSAFVAALFAVHPLHVESVAWVTELKDVLSGLFFMLTLLAYVHYARRPSLGRYALVAALFALGLMSKSILVTLPIILLLLDYWPLGRIRPSTPKPQPRASGLRHLSPVTRHLIEKLPLFALSVASAALTVWAQGSRGGLVTAGALPLGVRGANAVLSYGAYLRKTVWPAGLACLYPHPGDTLPVWQVAASALLLAAITVLVVALRKRMPALLVGWVWYLVMLLPVSGLLQVGRDAMTDRFSYLPLIGVFVALSWGLGDLIAARSRWLTRAAVAAALALVTALGAAANRQAGFWRDSTALFEHAIAVTDRNSVAHNNLATVFMEQGDPERAAHHLAKALEYHPEYAEARYNLGTLLGMAGQMEDARRHLSEAIRLQPGHAQARNNLGLVYMREGRLDLAAEQFEAALAVDPSLDTARENLELVRSQMNGGPARSPQH